MRAWIEVLAEFPVSYPSEPLEQDRAAVVLAVLRGRHRFLANRKSLMGTSRHLTEIQLKDAKHAVALRSAALDKTGLDQEAIKRDATWRKLDAKARQINSRLRRIGEVEALNAEVLRLREEKLAAAAVEEAPAEVEAPKKKKAKEEKPAAKESKPKAEGGDSKAKGEKKKGAAKKE